MYNKYTSNTKEKGICDHCGGREFLTRNDDSIEILNQRIEQFNQETKPLRESYKSHITEINAERSPEIIYQQIVQKM